MQHPRFGPNPTPATLAQIEAVDSWIKAQTTAFTTTEAHRGIGGSFGTTYKRLRELRDAELVLQVNDSPHTPTWLHVDQLAPEVDAEPIKTSLGAGGTDER
ncbi:hypothetical protein ACVDFE_00075 [Lentzea chajnantorensis]